MKKLYFFLLCFTIKTGSFAQINNLSASLEAQTGYTSNNTVPFWLRSNKFGSVPLPGASVSFIPRARKEYDSLKIHLVDWGASFEGRLNAGQQSTFRLIEGFVKLRAGIFELKGGRVKEVMGLVDTSLSSGAFSVSGNALGIPKIQIGIPEFSNVFGGKLFAFKGNFSLGWMGKVNFKNTGATRGTIAFNTFFHESSLYGRFGKPTWKLKLFAGINHEVMWNNDKVSENGLQPGLPTYLYVISGKTYRNFSKVGNHLGSVDIGFQYEFPSVKLFIYRQNFYDAGALSHLANINDGLNGISIENKRHQNNKFTWNKLLFEILNTRNQAGYPWSRKTKSGDENYYNNYLFTEGWSYNQMNLGSPFLTSRATAKRGQVSYPNDYFINNRVLAFHAGMEASIQKFRLISKVSYSENYGTFGTSYYGHSLGSSFSPPSGQFKETGQFSCYFEGSRDLNAGLQLGIVTAFDIGSLLRNSFGVICRVSKSF